MKKLFLLINLFILLLVLAPVLVNAQIILVPCGNAPGPTTLPGTTNPCTINDFFALLNNIFNFVVYWVATPLAILMLTIGGIMIMISAGNPNLAGTMPSEFVKSSSSRGNEAGFGYSPPAASRRLLLS